MVRRRETENENSKAKLLQLIMLKEEHENNSIILASYVNIFTTFVG